MSKSYSTDAILARGLMVLACPFCGSWSVTAFKKVSCWVQCDGCGANGPEGEKLAEAVAKWNGRLTEAVRIVPMSRVYEATNRAVHGGNGAGEGAS